MAGASRKPDRPAGSTRGGAGNAESGAADAHTALNQQIVDAVAAAEKIAEEGQRLQNQTGPAYRSVAQSASMVVQDAAESLRSTATISDAAIGRAYALMLEDPDRAEGYRVVIEAAGQQVDRAILQFETISAHALDVLNGLPRAADKAAGKAGSSRQES